MTHEMQLLILDVAAERRTQITALQIVCRQRVASQQRLTIALRDQLSHHAPRLDVEAAGRSQHPDNIGVMFFFIFEQFY